METENFEKPVVQRYLSGKATLEDIEDAIEHWHFSEDIPNNSGLAEYLGFTDQQIALWIEDPSNLKAILDKTAQ